MDILQNVMDSSSHAMFTMDRQGIVTHINQQAKERFGLFNHSLYAHSAGRLEPGDLVILATTAMGADDGNLTPEDLAVIGIRDPRLRPNDILAAVGVYKGPGVKPVYKYLRGGESVGLHLDVTFQGVPISVHIGDKQIAVEVREKVYSITYFVSICQTVILDHRTRQVKFWEEKGYSARKEGLGSLLRRALGFTDEKAHEQFGFLLDAFKYGVPPHAGLAYGLDRLVMIMAHEDSIRDVIAFPKIKDASCLMTDAPNVVDDKQLEELSLEIAKLEQEQ